MHVVGYPLEPHKIVVVDDDHFNAALMREVCESAGYIVFEAYDEAQAYKLIQEVKPHLLLLDVLIGTKDGFQICEELRSQAQTAHMPIILVTAVDDLNSKVRGIELGVDDYITKPFRVFDLQNRIRSVIDKKNQQRHDNVADPSRSLSQEKLRIGGFRQLRWDLDYEFNRAQRYGNNLSCALITIDKFEQFYSEGNKKKAAELLAAVVTTMKQTLRAVDRIYRIEDDVFIILMPETSFDEARVPVERICTLLNEKNVSSSGPVGITVALASSPNTTSETTPELLRNLTNTFYHARPDENTLLF